MLALIGQADSEEIFEIVDGRRRRTELGHPISSPCGPSAQVS